MSKDTTISGLDSLALSNMGAQESSVKKAENLGKKPLNSEKDIDKASSGFEALLLHQMLSEMWKTVDTANLFNEESNQSQIYRDMLNQAIADSVAEGRGIGVKSYLKRELLKTQTASKKV